MLPLGSAFLIGAYLYLFRDQKVFRPLAAAAAGVALLLGGVTCTALPMLFGFSYLVVFVGTRPWSTADRVRRHGDPSYGIYLYAWPVQQIVVAAGVTTPLAVFGIAAPIAVALGYASWFLVERRAKRLLRRDRGASRKLSGESAA